MLTITQSKLRAFMECPKKAMLKQAGIKAKTTDAKTQFGSIWHEVMEYYFASSPANRENFDVWEHIAHTELSEHSKKIMVSLFDAWYGVCQFKMMDVRPEVCLEIPNFIKGCTLRGKADGLLINSDQKTKTLIEFKTKSVIDERKIMDNLYADLQLMVYDTLSEGSISEVWYNVVRRPSLRQGAKESEEEFTQRCVDDIFNRPEWYVMTFVVKLTDKDHKQNYENVLTLAENFKKANNAKKVQQNVCSCTEGNYPCEYVALCRYNDYLMYDALPRIDAELNRPSKFSKKVEAEIMANIKRLSYTSVGVPKFNQKANKWYLFKSEIQPQEINHPIEKIVITRAGKQTKADLQSQSWRSCLERIFFAPNEDWTVDVYMHKDTHGALVEIYYKD